jgi:hypothetical protein
MTHRRHSPTDGENRSGGGWEFAEHVRSGALGVILVTRGCNVGQSTGALVISSHVRIIE